MGTRSLTKVIETYTDQKNKTHKNNLVCMYRQHDGYPSVHGKELSEFLENMVIVNGLGLNDRARSFKRKLSNGMGCLSAQLISHFKTDVGNIYIQPSGIKRDWEDFEYIIEKNEEQKLNVKVNSYNDKEIFNGNVDQFIDFCNKED